MRRLWPALLGVALALGCGGGDGKAGAGAEDGKAADEAKTANYATNSPDPNDPCTLVSQAEMEHFIGPLLEPPYRVKNRSADPGGSACLYRARDYRNVSLDFDREDGELGFRMLVGTGKTVEKELAAEENSPNPQAAPWDKVGRTFGQLIALKGTASVQVDPLGSRLDLPAQVEIIKIALGRLQKPLGYDGGGAARNRKDVGVKPRDPCTLVTRAEVEAAMGPLRADPHTAEEGTECVFPLAQNFMGTPVDQNLEVHWADGFYALGQERQSLGMASKMMTKAMGPDIPTVGQNVAGEKEPWDERITLLGGVITVVKRDVMLKMAANGVGGFDEAKALTLLRSAANRI